ncbi:methyl-accepting chemotaxis sensory transducer with Cache sensor [Clostridium acidisoli DSM 12555]|uniref:Methyl-accepting chemotaxis sensory transducer with Cache sensor n=1 Tax=Clostridium acidisoli DSM 12555 TaxID=1121291 RepID=A0A1W1XC77_9CLOT|nr:methyl-accepting chemotaxis protein [Clostridium acidisoli]SMC21556.1 methyl-accepting chemotaxis sensory transducer with Cache sensor [Clostridium acidisoli DSM 12555]
MKKNKKYLQLKFKDSISLKIISIVILLVIMGIGFIGTFIYAITYNKMFSMSENNMQTVSTQIYNNFNTLIQAEKNDVKEISVDGDIKNVLEEKNTTSEDDFLNKNSGNLDNIKYKLKQYASLNKYDENIFVTDKNGFIIACSNDNFQRFDLSTHDYMKSALQGSSVMSNVYTSVVSIKPVVTFVEPIKDGNGNIIGTVGKNVYTDYFSETFDKFKFLNSGYIFIVDNMDNTIYSPNKMNINKKINIKEISKLSKDNKFWSSSKSQTIKYNKDGEEQYAYCTSVPQLKVVLVLTVKVNEIESAPKMIGLFIILIAIILIILLTIILSKIIKAIFKPMNTLIINTKEISKGNLTVINNAKNTDEIGNLSVNFNNMVFNLKKLIEEINECSSDFVNINDGIKESYSSIVLGMKSVNENSEDIAGDTVKIFNAVESSFNSFETVKVKTENIKYESEKVLKEAIFIKDINTEGLNTINELKNINLETDKKMSEANGYFDILKKNLSNIEEVGNTVTQISKRTHILALNAAIEAGRSGEMGKGFSVVADEIKKLSSSVSEQMNKIYEILKDLNLDMNNTQNKIKDVNSYTNQQFDLVNDAINNYDKMLNSSQKIVDYMNDAYSSIEMLDDENSVISERLIKIKDAYEEFNGSIATVNEILSEKYEDIKDVYSMLEKMHNNSDKLVNSIHKFKV